MALALRRDDDAMGDMNTTPLIDVMLVLLVMLIITIPPQTHKIGLDLPGGPPPKTVHEVSNTLEIKPDGRALWNGEATSDDQLRATLAAMVRIEPQPELHFVPDSEARYERVDEVLAITKRAQVTKMGFVGNERYARF